MQGEVGLCGEQFVSLKADLEFLKEKLDEPKCKHPLKQVQVKVETPNLDQDEEEQIHRGADRWDAARA